MARSKIIVAGQSHIAALGVPLQSPTGGHALVPLDHGSGRFYGMAGTWPRDNAAYWEAVRQHAHGAVVAILWGGNNHMRRFLFAPEQPFDVVIASEPDLPVAEDAALLPEEALRTLLPVALDNLAYHVRLLEQLGATPIIVGTPPPKEDLAFIRETLCKEQHFVEQAKSFGWTLQEAPLSPPLLLYKLWVITQEIMREFARAHDLVFAPVPVGAQTRNGYLRPEFYSDATHANRAYGALVTEAIWELCRPFLLGAALG